MKEMLEATDPTRFTVQYVASALDYHCHLPSHTTMHAIQVTLVKAMDLPSADYNGKSDPYVAFNVGSSTQKSSKQMANLHPEWTPSEVFHFITDDAEETSLHVKIYDYDRFSQDDLIASVSIPLGDYVQHPMKESQIFDLDIPSDFSNQQRKSKLMLHIQVEEDNDTD